MSNIQKKVGLATKWSSITEVASRLIAPFTNLILARLLVPEVFGVVATLTLVVSFAEVFTDAGFQKYLVQHEFKDEDDLNLSTNVAFWTNFIFSLLIWGVIAVFSKPIASLIGASGYEAAIIAISIEIPLLAFSSIQMARYRRSFDFKSLFVSRMAVSFVPLLVTIPAALIFKSHWALVIGTLTKDVLNAVILTAKSKWKPQFKYSLKKLKEMASFSIWTVCENISIWLTVNIDIFLVGTVLSSYYLGLYKTTMTTANSYMGIITAATTPVLFSALSRCQNNEVEFKKVFYQFQRTVAMLVFPLGFGAFIFRDFVTTILLGSHWMETADFLGMWFLTSAFTIVFSNYNSEAFRSIGSPKLSIFVQLCSLALLIPAVMLSVRKDYQVLTVVRALVRMDFLISLLVLQKTVNISISSIIKNVWPSLVSAFCMAIVGYFVRLLSGSILWSIISILICVAVYAALMLLIPAGRRLLSEFPITRRIFHLSEKR